MSGNSRELGARIQAFVTELEQESAALQVVGRPLTEAEQERVRALGSALGALREAVTTLTALAPPAPTSSDAGEPLTDGRYQGGNSELFVDLRIDEELSVISADLFRLGPGGRSYVASVRTAPGRAIDLSAGEWVVVGQDEHGGRAEGRLALRAQDSKAVATLLLENALHGLPVRTDIVFVAERRSDALRTLGIELEREQGVDGPPSFEFQGREVTLETSFADAGIEIVDVGQPSVIPNNPNRWGTSQLHTLMQDFAQASLTLREWELHLLWLARSTRSGLLGIMFDSSGSLPRQGTAVFADEIRSFVPVKTNRKLIQTTVHELGHALNLAHRFERSVGRADSTSFMNYDWRFGGGNRRQEFWSRFAFTFDQDELEFLRHAPLSAVIPGGAAFHSINYWADGNGGYSPYVPEVPLPGFHLQLTPPAAGPVFEFAQPVFLQVELVNQTGNPLNLGSHVLDPKGGLLEILIRRRTGAPDSSLDGAEVFVPIVQRCFDFDPQTAETVPHGGSIRNNLNLTFGSGGFSFAEIGEYDVIALVVIPDEQNERELVIRSEPLRIRVAPPRTREEDHDAMVLLREDVGLYFALGGSDGLERASDDLEAVRQRRQGKKKSIADPVVANIVRCAGINAGRPYVRYRDGSFSSREGDAAESAKLLGSLGTTALAAFDQHTREGTGSLARKARTRAGSE